MPDLTHYFGQDLTIGPTGDLLTSAAGDMTRERVIRRLMTAPGAYIWHPEYGAGIGAMIGQPADARRIQGVIAGQVMREAGVAQEPAPTVEVAADQAGTVVATITYGDAENGAVRTIELPAGAGF